MRSKKDIYTIPGIAAGAAMSLVPCCGYYWAAFKTGDGGSPAMFLTLPFVSVMVAIFALGLIVVLPSKIIEKLAFGLRYWPWLGAAISIAVGLELGAPIPIFDPDGLHAKVVNALAYYGVGASIFSSLLTREIRRQADETQRAPD